MTPPPLRHRLRRLLALLLACALLPASAPAQDVSEYGMKAVLFFRLSQFVYWPGEAPPRPVVLCVVGRNPFGGALDQIDRGNPGVEIRLSPPDIAACHMLFVPRSEAGEMSGWIERAAARRIVTVSDLAGFARAGGMVELPLEGGRVGIVVNRRAAQKQGFEFSAQLLRLARVIEP